MKKNIRNFCIIAHIDHWKSTLSDRMLEITQTIRKSEKTQVLDKMELEQERWITIKLTPVRMNWKNYQFNLIDTPGHVDFQYEVSRSLASVEGAILLVDASQWIQAQTLSTLYQAMEQDLQIIPVLNKIDLPAANPEKVANEIEQLIWIPKEEVLAVSGKTWEWVEELLDVVIDRIPAPDDVECESENKNISRALIFDSVYDPYKWVVSYIKMVNGNIKTWEKLALPHTENEIVATEVGFFAPDYVKNKQLNEWEIGYIVTWEKSVREVSIWDTLLWNIKFKDFEEIKKYAIPGFKWVVPFVYAWLYPIETTEYDKLKDSLEKLSMNDSAIEYTMEDSKALWLGFRCGFLWMLHMDIIKERLSREYNIETIFTTPTVAYLVKAKNKSLDIIKSGSTTQVLIKTWYWKTVLELEGELSFLDFENLSTDQILDKYSEILNWWILVNSGAEMIAQWECEQIFEPIAEVEIVWPSEFTGEIMGLCQEYRWEIRNMENLDQTRTVWKYNLPMWEIIVDFYDKLKSITKWYATMNYEFKEYKQWDLVKLDIFVNWDVIEALSWIVHKEKSYYMWREIVKKLKDLIPRHMFAVPIQAWVWNKMIARETIPAMRKDVIAKCYWWDVSRKKKLLKKQKEWKKKMKSIWKVNVPGDVFIKMVWR